MSHVSYDLGDLRGILKREKPSSVCLVTSKNVISKARWALEKISVPSSRIIFLPDGEKAKEWKMLEKLLKEFSRLQLDRSSVVIILGGGTIGDMAGFAASIYLRGIRYIQIPTTLVAQVDSAHGGKTGINFSGYKNQVGAMREPLATIVDIRFLRSLPEYQVIDGLGEIIKCGLIRDKSILKMLANEHVSTLMRSPHLQAIVRKTINVKNHYASGDMHDTAQRQMLNFGHTCGHAIELVYGLGHGHAVIVGMLQELRVTESLGFTPLSVRTGLITLLNTLGIHIPAKKYKPRMRLVIHDKKVKGSKLLLPIVTHPGKSKIVTISLRAFQQSLKNI